MYQIFSVPVQFACWANNFFVDLPGMFLFLVSIRHPLRISNGISHKFHRHVLKYYKIFRSRLNHPTSNCEKMTHHAKSVIKVWAIVMLKERWMRMAMSASKQGSYFGFHARKIIWSATHDMSILILLWQRLGAFGCPFRVTWPYMLENV